MTVTGPLPSPRLSGWPSSDVGLLCLCASQQSWETSVLVSAPLLRGGSLHPDRSRPCPTVRGPGNSLRELSPGLRTPGSATEPSPSHVPGGTSGPGAAARAGPTGLRRTGRSLRPWSSHSRRKAREMTPWKHAPGVTSDGDEWYPEEKTERHAGKGLGGGGDCGQGGQGTPLWT